ncbi:class I SAM-dependent DNA methyltransferase [Escherichia coli]|uniref:site-specific DNA-methyltransferase (adenine-specific) n=4 Tax=Escherichia coli TaxID=562 RepID=A0A6D0HCI7_ECOLX|nr:class I SAM-dependent DNA methyltransferase [Escherichia coli]KAE9733681.1 N-6 DNA methylase [Escherichia coli]KAE9734071.1 N-6 DNA methylase [Escherichia coli]MVV58917.1 N-6 DNA methylase [Escherichia coli]MVV69810.1 N-6 DNA methylase [Escherichia coli]MWN39563.1 N-6 DNA methylase [Escherichia coli]
MITGDLKSKIDGLWEDFWVGGITNPLTVIEQITYLMYSRMLDTQEQRDEKRKQIAGIDFKPRFMPEQQEFRFSHYSNLGSDEMMEVVRDGVFQHFRQLGQADASKVTLLGNFMKDARLEIVKPSLLTKAVEVIKNLPLDRGDTKGDLYEYLLSKLTTAGINGQFRTPRHIIRTMVEMMEPNPARGETICDPACGTGGFLATSYEYLLEKYSSLESIHTEIGTNERGELEEQKIFTGDLLTPWRNHVDNNMFHGYDFDTTMLRIAAMNLIMHGVEAPDIHYQDTMSQSFSTNFPQASKNAFNLILANPPFTGSLDEEDIDSTLSAMVKTKKTELLFLARILQMLKVGGRSATIVPQGVLFGSSKAHQSLRKTLVEDNQLEAVINLPSGVFKPYAGVTTAILIFTKGGQTDEVWFYDLQNDGYSLDDKRNPIKDNDLPHLLASWKHYRTLRGLPVDNFMGERLASLLKQQYPEGIDAGVDFKDRTQVAFVVPKADIAAQKYDLSINRYKEVVYQSEEYEDPKVILKRLKDLEKEILADLDELEEML